MYFAERRYERAQARRQAAMRTWSLAYGALEAAEESDSIEAIQAATCNMAIADAALEDANIELRAVQAIILGRAEMERITTAIWQGKTP